MSWLTLKGEERRLPLFADTTDGRDRLRESGISESIKSSNMSRQRWRSRVPDDRRSKRFWGIIGSLGRAKSHPPSGQILGRRHIINPLRFPYGRH